jgi:hypothetical protein
MEARDPKAVRAAFAPDVRLSSPILDVPFRGRDEVGDLFEIVMSVIGSLEYHAEIPGDPHVLYFSTDIDGVPLQGVDILHLDENGLISEITVFLRPFPGIAAVLRATGAKLARKRKGPAQAALATATTPPLSGMMRLAARVSPGMLGLRRDE